MTEREHGDDGSAAGGQTGEDTFDVVVVGAGFAGMYLLHRLRGQGLRVRVFETGSGVGGTWYWNRYPGARCDVRSIDYSYSWDPQLEQEWEWSEKFATQPEILRYANHVADRYDLRRDITFDTRVTAANWDEQATCWRLRTSTGASLSATYYVMASGCLSSSKHPEIDGIDRFAGATYHTGHWPHEGVDLSGLRVAVIGTGSSGIQSIPLIASQAAQLTVFQRTPNFSLPARNGVIDPATVAEIKARYPEDRAEARLSSGGSPRPVPTQSALDVADEERTERYRTAWEAGELGSILTAYTDLMTSREANDTAADFIRDQIRSIVRDPEVAEALCPDDHPFGTKRPCLDTGYYETYNRPNVRLVNLRKTPIVRITETGIDTTDESFAFDAIVFATGFDAMTGAIVAVDIVGRDGLSLKQKWSAGPRTYLGLGVAGFPNFFTITGPGSPSVLSNMMVSIEQHVDWITDCLTAMRRSGQRVIEAEPGAEDAWVDHVNEVAAATLYPSANSWYMGANVPGKPRVFLPYVGGVGTYRTICDEVAADGYRGFTLSA
ncbi:MAG: NAD(P)/FAD-dependent oxidoreductase [Acidimicrobiales bacterium]